MWNVIYSNRFLQRKLRQQEHRRHRNSVHNAKAVIAIEAPPSFGFLASNPKKAQIKQQHLREIQLANTDLLRKMTSSTKKDSPLLALPERVSLNHAYSKRVSSQITKENQKLLWRLRDTSSSINFSKMEKQHQKTQRLKQNLSKVRPVSASSTKRSFMRPLSAR